MQLTRVDFDLQGNLISYFENSFMRSASRHEDVPELTDLQKRALKAFEDLADSTELRMDYVLQAGDIQLLHNHSIVHARTAYVDHDDVSIPPTYWLLLRSSLTMLQYHMYTRYAWTCDKKVIPTC